MKRWVVSHTYVDISKKCNLLNAVPCKSGWNKYSSGWNFVDCIQRGANQVEKQMLLSRGQESFQNSTLFFQEPLKHIPAIWKSLECPALSWCFVKLFSSQSQAWTRFINSFSKRHFQSKNSNFLELKYDYCCSLRHTSRCNWEVISADYGQGT